MTRAILHVLALTTVLTVLCVAPSETESGDANERLRVIAKMDVTQLSDRELNELLEEASRLYDEVGRTDEANRVLYHVGNEIDRREAPLRAAREKKEQAERATREKKERAERSAREAKARADAEAARAAKIRAQRWPPDIEAAVINGKIKIGMTTEQVRAAWGNAQRVNQTIRASGTSEQWIMGDGQYLYFENGRLTAIQTSQ